MKHIFLSGLILLLPVCAIAQEKAYTDTTIFIGNKKLEIKESAEKIKVKIFEPSSSGDTIENDQIFEGVYKDGKVQKGELYYPLHFTANTRTIWSGSTWA